jgi:hypothetical protein
VRRGTEDGARGLVTSDQAEGRASVGRPRRSGMDGGDGEAQKMGIFEYFRWVASGSPGLAFEQVMPFRLLLKSGTEEPFP